MYTAFMHICNQFYIQLKMIYLSEFIRMIILVSTYHQLQKTNVSKKMKFKIDPGGLLHRWSSSRWKRSLCRSILRTFLRIPKHRGGFLVTTLGKMNGGHVFRLLTRVILSLYFKVTRLLHALEAAKLFTAGAPFCFGWG